MDFFYIMDDDICSICQEAFTIVDEVNLSCAHSFHKECIKKWFQTCHTSRTEEDLVRDPAAIDLRNPCPMCRCLRSDDDWDRVFHH